MYVSMFDVSSTEVVNRFDGGIIAYEKYQKKNVMHDGADIRRIYGNLYQYVPKNVELVKNKPNLEFGFIKRYNSSNAHYPEWHTNLIPFSKGMKLSGYNLDSIFNDHFIKMRLATPLELKELNEGLTSKEIIFNRDKSFNEDECKKINEISINFYFKKFKILQLINKNLPSHTKLPKELISEILGMALRME